ncbi:MAG: hypothetical protein ACRDZO_28515 [Egibacteraceae bacterium]
MSVVLDAGALIGVERRDRRVRTILRAAEANNIEVRTSAAAVAQVWRDGARQAHLARTLTGVATVRLDLASGKRVGTLLGASRTHDIVDGHVASLVSDGDQVLTSDPDDLLRLLDARGVTARITLV